MIKDTSLVAWYPMTKGSGTTLYDYSGNANNGTITGADWKKNSFQGGYALDFNGTSDYVDLGSDLGFTDGDDLSFSFWFNTADVSGVERVLSGYDTDVDKGWDVIKANDYIIFRNTSSAGNYLGKKTGTITVSTWYHLAGTLNGSTGVPTFYLDGVEQTATDNVGSVSSSNFNNRNVTMGAIAWETSQGSNNFFNGIISNVKIVSRTISPEEIKADYNSTYRV